MEEKIDEIKKHIKSYPDFPVKDVLFRDIFSILKEPRLFSLLKDVMVHRVKEITPPVDSLVALESRGFLLAPFIGLELGIPIVPIRKKGKLPGKVKSVKYTLEYGEDIFEMQDDALQKGHRVVVVDDLLATGGSLSAAHDLITLFGAEIVECLVVMELTDLKGREKVPSKVFSLIQY